MRTPETAPTLNGFKTRREDFHFGPMPAPAGVEWRRAHPSREPSKGRQASLWKSAHDAGGRFAHRARICPPGHSLMRRLRS